MSMEEYIISELQSEKAKREELEKKVREMEDERSKIENGLRDAEWLVKKTEPRLTKSGYIYSNSAFFHDEDEIARAMRVYARLGIQVKDEYAEEYKKEEEPK